MQVVTQAPPTDYIISKESVQKRRADFMQRGRRIAAVYKSPLQHPFKTDEVDL